MQRGGRHPCLLMLLAHKGTTPRKQREGKGREGVIDLPGESYSEHKGKGFRVQGDSSIR